MLRDSRRKVLLVNFIHDEICFIDIIEYWRLEHLICSILATFGFEAGREIRERALGSSSAR